MTEQICDWKPLRPTAEDIERIGEDVAAVSEVQEQLLEGFDDLKQPDRVAHQYQIAGSPVVLEVAEELPEGWAGVGIFEPGARHRGVGRISTGLGGPHLETNPDFLGILLAFQTRDGHRVDFIGINDPTAPTDDHHLFMALLQSTGESAGAKAPFLGNLGELIAEQTVAGKALIRRCGLVQAVKTLGHVAHQTSRTLGSSTAYQTYWTGIVEVAGNGGKFAVVPVENENHFPGLHPGGRHFTDEWRTRQQAGEVVFSLFWIPFVDQKDTPTAELTERWQEDHNVRVGTVTFPRTDPGSEEAKLWAALASEMGGNPGNWVHDRGNTIPEPATEFGLARKLAYRISQRGRNALDPALYRSVFESGEIGAELAEELRRRREVKDREGHVSWAPR